MRTLGKWSVVSFAILLLIPLAWMFIGAFQHVSGTIATPPVFKAEVFGLWNWKSLFRFPVWRWLLNSAIVSSAVVFASMVVNCSAGYGFAKKAAPEIVFWIMLAAMMIPGEVTLIPRVLVVRGLGLFDSYWAMIIPGIMSGFLIFFYRAYLARFPNELLEAADSEGAGELYKLWRIVVPLTKPAVATMAVLTFVGVWSSFVWQLIVVRNHEMKTLPVGAAWVMLGEQIYWEHSVINYGLIMALAVFAFIPILLLFLLFQKQFVASLYAGGMR